ncbi:MAG TPA: uracil-DNA glycosylase family protein [Sphingomicrobium sp.]|nr:uracil-DNA glycosylase family protein [Sphingomicrobium sp.]
MGGEIKDLSRAEAASLLGWWLDAGVDAAISEQPRDWLRPGAPIVAAAVEAPAPAHLPDTLETFRAWLQTAPGLPLDRAGARRILPHGPAEAEIMLVSEFPTREDAGDGKPIGGTAWQLMIKMLGAIGMAEDAAYSASLACFHLPAAKLDADSLGRCGDLMRHHIALAAPKRLLLLGDAPARALTGQPLASARGKVHRIEGVRTVATFHPRFLLARPSDKALAWRDLLLLTDEEMS